MSSIGFYDIPHLKEKKIFGNFLSSSYYHAELVSIIEIKFDGWRWQGLAENKWGEQTPWHLVLEGAHNHIRDDGAEAKT